MTTDEMMLQLKSLGPSLDLGVGIRAAGDWYLVGKRWEVVDDVFAGAETEISCATPEAAIRTCFENLKAVGPGRAIRYRIWAKTETRCVRWNGAAWEDVPEPGGPRTPPGGAR